MRELKTKIARRIIRDPAYLPKRMDVMNGRIVTWLESASRASTSKERQFCCEMANVYLKRYNWYINEYRKSI